MRKIQKNIGYKKNKISNIIIPSINKILEQKNNTIKDAKIGYEIILKYIKNTIKNDLIKKNVSNIEKVFEELNAKTKTLNTKKLYVSYPRTSLNIFDKLSLIDKLDNVLIKKQNNSLGENTNSNGGNCHNWTLIYKEIFDDLKIKNNIILLEPITAHSFLLIEIDNDFYIADGEGNKKFNLGKINIGDIFDIGNHKKMQIKSLAHFKIDILDHRGYIKKYNFTPGVYNKNEFINFIDTKKRDYFFTGILGYRQRK